MRKIGLIFTFSLIFFSCEKNSFVPENEIPDWLKTSISNDEQKIKEAPKAMSAWGAWLRYKWENEYYFEYENPLSSSLYIPISVNGDSLYISPYDTNVEYFKGKCCKQYVWKGPLYIEF